MKKLLASVQKEICHLERVLSKVDAFLVHAPEGSLKWQKVRKKLYYYHQYKEPLGDKWERRYITKENEALAKALAKKQYYMTIKCMAVKQLYALRKMNQNCPDQELDEIYDGLCEERKVLIEPIRMTVKERVQKWWEEPYGQNSDYLENLRYETEQGEMVRSKSEVIIANILYKHRKDILYKYEKPLLVQVAGGREITIYPDFTIMNIHTGKLCYWEHAGLMDEELYARRFVKKMNTYVQNGLIPGKDVLTTYETQETPLDIGVVHQLIRTIMEAD